ncbi:MAG: hypothetical protein ACE5KV_01120 [Thermoplasmata archaeon]
MTKIVIDDHSEVNSSSWTYDTLRPPKLTPYNTWKDLTWHYRRYRSRRLDIKTIILFLLLRMIQRISYNVGWKRRRACDR